MTSALAARGVKANEVTTAKALDVDKRNGRTPASPRSFGGQREHQPVTLLNALLRSVNQPARAPGQSGEAADGQHAAGLTAPSPPLGAERVGVSWGNTAGASFASYAQDRAGGATLLTPTPSSQSWEESGFSLGAVVHPIALARAPRILGVAGAALSSNCRGVRPDVSRARDRRRGSGAWLVFPQGPPGRKRLGLRRSREGPSRPDGGPTYCFDIVTLSAC
jgi:hypothetical protein